jgi:hypothetical protein
MGKKRSRSKLTSKGIHSTVNSGLALAVRRDVSALDRSIYKTTAWAKGLNPWITIENPTKQTNMKYIKVRANNLYGDPKFMRFSMSKGKGEGE